MAPLAKTRWRRVVTRCTGRIGSLIGLLRGELSSDVLAVLTDPKDGLFPEPRELELDCSCPDSAEVCKHVAAVLYGVAIRLDARPELFFELRQADQAELIDSATAGVVARGRPAEGKRIAANACPRCSASRSRTVRRPRGALAASAILAPAEIIPPPPDIDVAAAAPPLRGETRPAWGRPVASTPCGDYFLAFGCHIAIAAPVGSVMTPSFRALRPP